MAQLNNHTGSRIIVISVIANGVITGLENPNLTKLRRTDRLHGNGNPVGILVKKKNYYE